MGTEELDSWTALAAARIPGALRPTIRQRGAAACLKAGGVGKRTFDPSEAQARARLLEPFLSRGGRILGGPDERSLGAWSTRARPPLCAFARGGIDLWDATPAIAIVGSREASDRGSYWARHMARALVDAGAVIVSGGAEGIDRAAHEACLTAGGRTIAVLGSPIRADGDERPLWMQPIFDRFRSKATSVSVFGPWTPRAPQLFAARNHYIAALVDAVIVVEGRLGSGTRHTAEAARALGIPLWCPPGDPEASELPNAWIESGAAHRLDPRRAAELILGRLAPKAAPAGKPEPAMDEPGLLGAIRRAGGRLLVDEAARILGISAKDVMAEAAMLEMDDAVRHEGPLLVLG